MARMPNVKKRIWFSATVVTWPNCVLVGFSVGPCHCWRLKMFCASKRSCHVRLPPAPKLRWIGHVRERQRHAAHAVDAERERALLERGRRLRRIALEAGIDVEPALAGRVVDARCRRGRRRRRCSGRPSRGARRAGIPRCRSAASCWPAPPRTPPSVRKWLAAAERQLVAGRAGETPRTRVVAALPQRRLAVVLLDRAVVADRVGVEREEPGEPVAEAAIHLHFERMRLRLAERQVGVGQVRRARRTDAAGACAESSPTRTSGSTPAADTAPGRSSAATAKLLMKYGFVTFAVRKAFAAVFRVLLPSQYCSGR